MRCLLLTACCFAGLFAAAKVPVEVAAQIDKLKISDAEKADFRAAYDEFFRAAEVVQELKTKHGLNKAKKVVVKADLVDPTIRAVQKQAAKYHNRFEVLSKTVRKWGPSTNLFARAARQSMQSRLDETRAERDLAKADAKVLKDVQKAARKFGKNIEKVRKDFEKYRDKAATEDEAAFWQSLLGIIPDPEEDDAK